MKLNLLCALLALLPASLLADEQIVVEAKFISAAPYVSMPHDLGKLTNSRVGIISHRATTTSGHEVKMETTRTFRIGNVATGHPREFPTGAVLHVTPFIINGHLAYHADLVFRTYRTQNRHYYESAPEFHAEFVSNELYLSGTPKDGEQVWVDPKEKFERLKFVLWLRFTRKDA